MYLASAVKRHFVVGLSTFAQVLPRPSTRLRSLLVVTSLAAAPVLLSPIAARASCATPANAIEAENCLAGAPPSAWSISGSGDASIQGFATDISVNRGGTVSFKVSSTASAWRLDIYRMGYYQANGARLVATVAPSVALPQPQPACLTNTTGLIDCGNWAVSASWAVPVTATSGIYFARAVRTDTGGASHIFFVVRDDASRSALLFQTSDATWQAYNDYGGNNLYVGNGAVGRAYKVSYNRPFNTAVFEPESWVFNAEYPMVRWLEQNGYDVTYHTNVDADRGGSPPIKNHKIWLSNGHDEYWSGAQRANVEAALAAGVDLAFFSSNTAFWKTRWETSIDGSGTPYRTLVCYKETHANGLIDPADPPVWTGTWRDPRFSPPADGGRPENALVGTLFRINGPWNDAITVPQADGRMRFWRNTNIATLGAGQTATLAPGTLGAEIDVDEDNGSRPPGLFGVSTNSITTNSQYLLDYGSTYGAGSATHRVTLYKHSSGALVFAAGTFQWSWGLDANHDRTRLGSTTDVRMQQATVNLFADMGVQPAALQAGLVPAVTSTDLTPPTSQITAPVAGATVTGGTTAIITGTASDAGGGVVGGVEVSTDGGTTWHPASGRESWSYSWKVPGSASWNLRSRAVDDSGNRETPSTGITVTVAGTGTACASNCTIWPATAAPAVADQGPDSAVELGVKFRSDVAGSVTGIRFYKASANTGTHVGNLWSSTGTRLATATFAAETASGWQQVTFATPVAIAANTVYVASYLCPAGHYSQDGGYFATRGVDTPPLHALQDGVSGGDGIYAYGTTSAFPSLTFQSQNYWVDVVFTPGASLSSIAVTPANPTVQAGATQQFTATGTYSDGSTQILSSGVTWASSNTAAATVASNGLASAASQGSATISATSSGVTGSTSLTVQPAALAISTTSLPGGTQYQAYSATLAGVGGSPPYIWSVTSGALPTGLSLNSSSGAITGTPTVTGTSTFTVQLRDAAAQFAVRTLSIVIAPAPPLAITTTALPGGNQYVAYSATLTASGGVPPYTWAIASGLPPGISLATVTGVLSGTPSTSGTFNFTVQVTDSAAQSTSKPLSIAVTAAPPLAITTASLPGGTVGTSYSATLVGTGGASPYTWAVTAGLPPGLAVNSSTGAITGVPTTASTYSLAVRLTDAVAQVATRSLNLVIVAPSNLTIWPATAAPTVVDAGPDAAVELGVRFRSEVAGSVTGIRFYKASANTGTHVGNLWSSTGTRLATATFTSETASGWQQVSFATPVAVAANTTYIASYLCPAGHYSQDGGYFATRGVDSPPLHAPQDSASAGNGVYAYGTTSTFPNSTFQSENYWVDLVFTPAPTLTSISVTPAAPTVPTGATQQFTAIGTYSDGSTQVLSSGVTWASSNTAVATVDPTGLAAPVGPGTTTISATVGTVAGSTVLTVTVGPLVVTTTSLPGANQYQAYSAALAAGGGTTPYTWAIAAGALPAGLTLNASTGSISGTPSGSGTASFTVQVTDSGARTSTQALSIAVAAAPPLTVTTASLPGGTVGVAYSATLAASGGRPPYTWSIGAGLPPTLQLNTATGVISGTTTTVGSYAFTVQILDAASSTASRMLTIDVSPPGAYQLWPAGTVPGTVDGGPDNPVEVGVRFKADQAGFITGIRFYKAAANTGTHVANLWSNTGTKLASATFTAETASGWQQVNFAAAVSIAAGTVYVASYHTNVGHYSIDAGYFGKAWDNVPLHALADSVSAGNGAYAYGTNSAFPNTTFQATNYWVDVVFNPSGPVPTVSSIAVTPATATISAPATQQYTAIATYSDASTLDVTREATWSAANTNVATMSTSGVATPVNAGTTSITATLKGAAGSASVSVLVPPPQANEGPGGPILVVSGSANYYSRYLAEIVRNEGFQEFLATDIANVTSATLAGYDLVVLGDIPLTAAQATMFANWVNGGGNLIAMHPDKQLAGLLGLVDAGGTLSNAYLLVDTTTAAGSGIVGQTIQFHGPADLYTLNGAQAIATLYSTAIASSGKPAVTLRTAGQGSAAAFTYDLARSVVYTRQGNPLWSGQQRDGLSPIRSDNLFFGASPSDPQPDWVDLSKVAIPQADEQQRLLANLILQMNLGKKPLPRFWYLPSGFKAAVIMTGDDHSSGGTAGRWDGYIAASPAGCSVADWKCVRGTSYLYAVSPLTNTQAVNYNNQGFEVALHVTTNCADFTSSADLNSSYTSQLGTFATQYPGIPAPVTNRTHCIVWSDYDTQPQVELANKIRLDTTYYYYPGTWVKDQPGFFTGSGWPMRFTDRTGKIIDVYQATSQMTDESNQTYPMTVNALLDGAVGPNGFYGVFTANMHTDQVSSTGSDAIVASAQTRGVPIVTSKQMLQWLDGRNGSSFGSLSWSANALSFTVSSAAGARNIQAMLPTQVGALRLTTLTMGTTSIAFSTQTIKGISYAIFPAATGSYRAVYQ